MKAPLAPAVVAVACLWTIPTSARSIIKYPGQHPKYALELEPHGLITPFSPPGDTSGWGWGAGVRGSFVIEDDGFISTINDSVAIGFGLDWIRYDDTSVAAGRCADWSPGPGGQPICRRVAGAGGDASYFYLPAVLQWNFWLHEEWSVFGEPGLALYLQHRYFDESVSFGVSPVFHAGGRWHFAERAALTLRAGYPAWSVGVSFLF